MKQAAQSHANGGEGTGVAGGFRVMRASAGSGKTFRLVEAYLACCLGSLEPLRFRRILALTFTNKAAQEMKDRVISELDTLALDITQSKHLSGLMLTTGLDEATLAARAAQLRRTLQRHYGELSVMTLDKFVGGLVRGFATDLQLEHDFSIELDTERLLETAVDRVLDRMGRDKDLTELLGRFVEQAVEDDRDAKVRRQLIDIGKAIEQEQMQPLLQAYTAWTPAQFLEVQDGLRKEVSQKRAVLRKAARELMVALSSAGLDGVFSRNWVMGNWLPSIVAGNVEERGSTLKTGVEEGQWARKTDQDGAAAIAPFQEQLEAVARLELEQAKCEAGRDFRTRRLLAERLPLIGTLTALRRASMEVQSEENVRTLGGLNAMIADVVSENPAPFIFERTGERYDHIFIDEFQDTSVTQWHNLAVAVGESLSQGYLSLVVGDAKQAIYRWRNGDHRQLLSLPDLVSDAPGGLPPALSDAAGQMDAAFEDEPILDNWRSAPEIVGFNNALYTTLGESLGADLNGVYAGSEQEPRKDFPGAVEVEVVQGETAEERFESVCLWMEARIRQAQEEGFSPGDIALLVRTNKEAKQLAEFLLGCTPSIVPFTDESLALGRHPAALAVVQLLELVVDPEAPGPLLKFVQAWGAMEVEAGRPWNEAEHLTKHHTWVEYTRTNGSKGRFGTLDAEGLVKELVPDFDRAQWSALPLGECMGRVLRSLDADKRYPAHAEALMELTSERAAMDHGISGFLSHWQRKGSQQSIRVLPGPDAVRILTVHKSKGLQYPVVITRFGDSDVHNSDTLMPAPLDPAVFGVPGVVVPQHVLAETEAHAVWDLEHARQRFDSTNVAYVCTTRAEVRLHVIIDVKKMEWRKEEAPGKLGRMVARGIEDAFSCDLTAGPWFAGDMKAAMPMVEEEKSEDVVSHAISGFAFHGIPDGVLAGRREDRDLPVLGEMDRREFGNAVHAVLARIRTADDAERVFRRRWPWLKCAEKDWEAVVDTARRVVTSEALAPWFDGRGKVYLERDLVGTDGKMVRPDRVVDLGDEIAVIDFKTAEETDDKKRAKHVEQVRGYMQALHRTNGPQVRGLVYYATQDELVEIDAL
jgi:ATP-dependent exoDNAse (exonuclease V) beta subunit